MTGFGVSTELLFQVRGHRVLGLQMGSAARIAVSVLVSVCLINIMTGCSSWKPLELPDYQANQEGEDLGHVLVTFQNGEHLELWSTRAEADSLIGYTVDIDKESNFKARPEYPDVIPSAEFYRISVPLEITKAVEVRKFSVGKTLGAAAVVVLGTVGTAAAAAAISLAGKDFADLIE